MVRIDDDDDDNDNDDNDDNNNNDDDTHCAVWRAATELIQKLLEDDLDGRQP